MKCISFNLMGSCYTSSAPAVNVFALLLTTAMVLLCNVSLFDAVPLNEVYLHHWIFLDKNKPNDGICPGYLQYIFGVGAETRDTPYDWPQYKGDIYGWFVDDTHFWSANIHALRTVNIDPNVNDGVKGCIECHGPNK